MLELTYTHYANKSYLSKHSCRPLSMRLIMSIFEYLAIYYRHDSDDRTAPPGDSRQGAPVRPASLPLGRLSPVPSRSSRESRPRSGGARLPGIRGALLSQSLPRLADPVPTGSPRRGGRKVSTLRMRLQSLVYL